VSPQECQYYHGTFMHTPAIDQLEILRDTLITVANGAIQSVLSPDNPAYKTALHTAQSATSYTKIDANGFLIPGLVDLHIHAPQWPQLGKALHLPLQDWLQKCTFPLEAKYSDTEFAETIYSHLIKNLLANGTTSAVYFATIHSRATEILAKLCLQQGQRAWVGRVAMDETTQNPEYYRDESTERGLQQSEASIQFIRKLCGNESSLVKPILTPRFIPSCTDDMLRGLGDLASQYNCHIQTHCSESDWEHQFVIDRLGVTDTQALNDFGLLNRYTILAHANFIDDSDMSIINKHQAAIAHCPLSNQYFAGGVFPLRKAIDAGLHVGLGTDISGGPSASQFDSCRQAISASRMLESGVNPTIPPQQRGTDNTRINFHEAFYLATAGGGVALDEPIGIFEKGYRFDALHIDPDIDNSNLMYFPDLDSAEDLFQKTLYGATRQNIKAVWVDGNRVSTHPA